MVFGDLEKREHKSFLQKHHAGAHANIEQKPYGASLRRTMREWSKKLCISFKGVGMDCKRLHLCQEKLRDHNKKSASFACMSQ